MAPSRWEQEMELYMHQQITEIRSPLFSGIAPQDRESMLHCTGYYIADYQKGQTIALEQEHISHIGIVLEGAVDMIKEDIWGNKTILARIGKDDLFGETFACGSDSLSVVSFVVSKDAKVLFMPFCKAMHTCANACEFHRKLTDNMVRIIADKNRDLLRKIEVISQKTLREKILAYLSIQAQQQKSRYVEIPLGRSELAEYLCADRTALARELGRMRDEGLIDYDKNIFRIL